MRSAVPHRHRILALALAASLLSCRSNDQPAGEPHGEHEVELGPVAYRVAAPGTAAPLSVATLDTRSNTAAVTSVLLPVEAKFLVLAADGSEPELGAIREALDYRGVPYDVFVADSEPPLTSDRLASGDNGFYQATILTTSSLSTGGPSYLGASEWAALADYETRFHVRRAVLNTWPDPALGFGSATTISTATTPRAVSCTAAGAAVFRDVNCSRTQEIEGASMFLARPQSGAPLTPLLTDAAGNAIAAVHVGADGRESLLLLFANNASLFHSLLFFHGVIDWVSGGTYLGDRRIDLSAQADDLFLASHCWTGAGQPPGTYRIDDNDLRDALAWQNLRRARASTPDFRIAWAFNAALARDGDPLTDAVKTQTSQWHWISHTYDHAVLDDLDYSAGFAEFDRNRLAASALGLVGFDPRNIVTPNVSGLVNLEVMRAAMDDGIRFAVTDTSRAGCDNPSPNTAFYNAIAPSILLVPRRATNLFYNVSTPTEWVSEYNHLYSSYWGRDSSYAQVLDQESDVLLHYLLRGETDPWMFHQANLRAYDGVHSLLGDLIDATLVKLEARSKVPVRTPPMQETGLRFADRMEYDGAGVRATLFRGRALVIDVARATSVPITGVRASDGEAYGGDSLAQVWATPGTSTCVPLDSTGHGCSPAPVRLGGAGTPHAMLTAVCNSSSAHPIDAGVADAAIAPPDARVAMPDAAGVPPPDGAPAAAPDAATADATPAAPPDAAPAPVGLPDAGHGAADAGPRATGGGGGCACSLAPRAPARAPILPTCLGLGVGLLMWGRRQRARSTSQVRKTWPGPSGRRRIAAVPTRWVRRAPRGDAPCRWLALPRVPPSPST